MDLYLSESIKYQIKDFIKQLQDVPECHATWETYTSICWSEKFQRNWMREDRHCVVQIVHLVNEKDNHKNNFFFLLLAPAIYILIPSGVWPIKRNKTEEKNI